MRGLLAVLTVVALLLVGRAARAQDDPGVVIVAIAPDTPGLDAEPLRKAIGQELACDAVSPDDARAPSARGRIDVSIDGSASQLVVSYQPTGGAPIVRRVDLPADAEATSRAAVLLAGNLARDEAADLVAQMRKPEPPPAPPPPDDEVEKSERLRHLLAQYAAKGRSVRLAAGWSLFGAAMAAGGAGLYLTLRGNGDLGQPLEMVGGELGFVAGFTLGQQATFEELSSFYEEHETTVPMLTTWLREDVERRWKRSADKAASSRVGWGIASVIVGTLYAAADITVWAIEPPSTTGGTVDYALGAAGGLAVLGYGVVMLAGQTEVEWRFHEYERGLGHPIELRDVSLRLTPVSGGLGAGLGGRF